MPVVSIYATADAETNDWGAVPSGEKWSAIDEVPQDPDDADYMFTTVNPLTQEFSFGTGLVPVGSTVTGFRYAYRVQAVGIQPSLRFRLFSLDPFETWALSSDYDVDFGDWENLEVHFTGLSIPAARFNDGNLRLAVRGDGEVPGAASSPKYVNEIPVPA
jgi:hypothetical protein